MPVQPRYASPRLPDHSKTSLARDSAERRDHHRALLLWVMQTPSLRSQRAVARSMGKADGTIRLWRQGGHWKERAESAGEHADQVALDLYRTEYMAEFGEIEIPHVAKGVVRSIGDLNMKDPLAAATEMVRQNVRHAVNNTLAEVNQATAQAVRERQADNKTVAKRHVRLVDGALGYIAKKLKDKDIKVSVRDIPMLLECRDRLSHLVEGHSAGDGVVVESARVKHAKETGGDLLNAMYEDAEECVLILGALRTRSGTDVASLAAEDDTYSEAVKVQA